MKKVLTYISCYGKYFFLFVFFFLCLQFFYTAFNGDQFYNFGFSYAISRGEIPYLDFNMIIPPFSAYFYAVFFALFGVELYIFNLVQAFLLCILFYFLFHLYGNKTWILFILLCIPVGIPFVTILFQGYNFLLLLELVLLIYLEKTNKNDYLIGFLLGISILTKQTVGLCFLLPTLYFVFRHFIQWKKVLKRIVGCLIPCLIFVSFLLITKTFNSFIDLCFLGMLDFTKSNGKLLDYNTLLFFIAFIFVIFRIFCNRKRIEFYYVLAFFSIAVPLFDYYHVTLFLFACSFLLLDFVSLKYKTVAVHAFIFGFSLAIIWVGFSRNFQFHLANFKHFNYQVLSSKTEKNIKDINSFISENKDCKLIILGANAYYLKIINDMDINYYDLLNYGNHGYQGTKKMIRLIQLEDNALIMINIEEYNDHSNNRQQINKDVMKYVMEHFDLVDKIGDYYIYQSLN